MQRRDTVERLRRVYSILRDEGKFTSADAVCCAIAEIEAHRLKNVGGDVGRELARLSEAATPGEWHVDMFPVYDEDSGAELAPMCEGICIHTPEHEAESILSCNEREASFIVALVNAYRSGRLIAAPAVSECGAACGAPSASPDNLEAPQ